jgi:cell pole-organizing protein PopZ
MMNMAHDDEMSMEEILASIRRYVADESAARPEASTSATETLVEPRPARPRMAVIEPQSQSHMASSMVQEASSVVIEPKAQPVPKPNVIRLSPTYEVRETAPTHTPTPAYTPTDSLIAQEVQRATLDSLTKLKHVAEESTATASNTQTVDHFIADLLKPLIKQWLDRNLPPIVERIVENEIKRLTQR